MFLDKDEYKNLAKIITTHSLIHEKQIHRVDKCRNNCRIIKVVPVRGLENFCLVSKCE